MAALTISVVVSVVVLLTLKQSIWTELEIITGLLALCMFAFLTTTLYLGVRFDKRERFSIDWPKGTPADLLDGTSFVPGDTSSFFTEAGAEAGVVGIIIGFILDVLVTIMLVYVIAAILWLGLNLLIAAVICIAIPLFYFHRRAIRSIAARGRFCRGNMAKSVVFALKSATGYTIWFYTIFFLAHQVQHLHGR